MSKPRVLELNDVRVSRHETSNIHLDAGHIYRRDFIFDSSLILYLPLWHPELNASATITSKDLNAFSGTVSGATSGRQGRTFDGTDDYILIPPTGGSSSLVVTDGFTIAAWYKPSSLPDATKTILNTTANLTGCMLTPNRKRGGVEAGGCVAVNFHDGTQWCDAGTTSSILTVDTWSFLMATYNRVNLDVLEDNEVVDSQPWSGAVAGVGSSTRVSVGAEISPLGVLSRHLPGTLGEVFFYNKALSLLERNRLYYGTKWRYTE